MNNLYSKDNMLPYVTEQPSPPVEQKVKTRTIRQYKNGLATASLVAAICSMFFGVLIIPPLLAIALGVGALIIAVKRRLSKKIPILAIVSSSVILITAVIGMIQISLTMSSESEPYVPPAYTYDNVTGVAYKYNPLTNIACDKKGECKFEATLFMINSGKCPEGGTFTPRMEDLLTSQYASSGTYPFDTMKNGDSVKLAITGSGTANGRLIEMEEAPMVVSCK